jgi:hypothetical protein
VAAAAAMLKEAPCTLRQETLLFSVVDASNKIDIWVIKLVLSGRVYNKARPIQGIIGPKEGYYFYCIIEDIKVVYMDNMIHYTHRGILYIVSSSVRLPSGVRHFYC